MLTSWTPAAAAADVLKLSGSELTCHHANGKATTLTVKRVYEGEAKFASQRNEANGGTRENPMRSYGVECNLVHPDGSRIQVVIVTAEFNNCFYAGLKTPELSVLQEIESQMTAHMAEVAKARLRADKQDPALPQIRSLELDAAALLGIDLSPLGSDDVDLDPI